jgi:hypothetical protein
MSTHPGFDPLVVLIAIARRQPVHEIAFHLIDLVGADLGKAFVEWLRPEAGGRVALIMPVFFEAFCEGQGAVAVQRVDDRGITGRLADLSDTPNWQINTTCIETGKNWRFGKREMGDWSFGRHYAPDLSLSTAVAASAAVPYVIGAMTLSEPECYLTLPIAPTACL